MSVNSFGLKLRTALAARAAWHGKLRKVVVERVRLPAKCELDVLLLKTGGVQGHTSSHSDGMGSKACDGRGVRDVVHRFGRELE